MFLQDAERLSEENSVLPIIKKMGNYKLFVQGKRFNKKPTRKKYGSTYNPWFKKEQGNELYIHK